MTRPEHPLIQAARIVALSDGIEYANMERFYLVSLADMEHLRLALSALPPGPLAVVRREDAEAAADLFEVRAKMDEKSDYLSAAASKSKIAAALRAAMKGAE